MAKKKCKHDWYISDGRFSRFGLREAEETCNKCGKKRIVKVM